MNATNKCDNMTFLSQFSFVMSGERRFVENLRCPSFRSWNKFYDDQDQELSGTLDSDQLTEFREVFDLYDKDGDGTISVKELGTVLRCLGQNPSDDDTKEIMESADHDGSGTLTFDEFLCLMIKLDKETFTEQEIKEAFKVFDKDGNGYISATELKHVMSKLGVYFSDEDLNEMVAEADVDGDGQVNFEEFYDMMTSK